MMDDYSPSDLEAYARTVAAEANPNDPNGQLAVANVIKNRIASGKFGDTPSKVVFAPGQFEVWSNGRAYGVDTRSQNYKSALDAVKAVIHGDAEDNTGGATHFFSPAGQTALGRNAPAWASGRPLAYVGGQAFYAPNGPVSSQSSGRPSDDVLTDFNVGAKGPTAALAAAGAVEKAIAPQPVPDSSKPFVMSAPPDMLPPPATAPNPQVEARAPSAPSDDLLTDFKVAAPAPSSQPVPPAPPSGIGVNDAGRALATGVPIIGGLLNKADAATNAALAPVLNPLFAPSNQLQGDTFADRYKNALAIQNGMDQQFAAQHPVANTALNMTGGVAGTALAASAAPAAFGISKVPLKSVFDVPSYAILAALTGGAIGGADSGIRTDFNPYAMKQGAIEGGILGGAAPFLGHALGKAVTGVGNALTRVGPGARNVADIFHDIGVTPQGARNALNRIGPEATLADVNPALTTEAGGLAALGGAPTAELKGAMAARAAAADNRVMDALDRKLGPKPDLTATEEAIYEDALRAASPHYEAMRANPKPMDATSVLSTIDARLRNAPAGGGEAHILTKAKNYLTDQKVGLPGPDGKIKNLIVPKEDPDALLKVRQELDDDIKSIKKKGTIDGTSAGRSALNAAYEVRSRLDSILKTDPNIAAGDAAFVSRMRLKDAVDAGNEIFTKGVRVEDFQRAVRSMSPEELGAMRLGARAAIGAAVEEARRGALSEAQSLFSRSSANRAKLDALFPNAGDVLDMIHGEVSMRATERNVASNSLTAERQAVRQKYRPNEAPSSNSALPIMADIAGGTGAGMATLAGKSILSGAKNALAKAAQDRLELETARGLAARSGPQQDEFLRKVEKAYRTNALSSAASKGASTGGNLLLRNSNALVPFVANQ